MPVENTVYKMVHVSTVDNVVFISKTRDPSRLTTLPRYFGDNNAFNQTAVRNKNSHISEKKTTYDKLFRTD